MTGFELSLLELEHGDFDRALTHLKAQAEEGDICSISLLADIYLYGVGTEKNESEYIRLCSLIDNISTH